jgi:hypothetical protein
MYVRLIKKAIDIYTRNLVKEERDNIPFVKDFYREILPMLPVYVSTLVRLLYYINLGPTNPDAVERTPIQVIDYEKQKNIITHAISNILLLVLKAFKRSSMCM